jgi:putative endonuclease
MNLLYRISDALRNRARVREMNPDHALGRLGEDMAHRHLRRNGYTIVARNYRTRSGSGEIDLVAWEGAALVFVEVKSRRTDEFGPPERNVDLEKRRHIVRAARDYVRRAEVPWSNVRFDIVTVLLKNIPVVRLQKDAFQVSETI